MLNITDTAQSITAMVRKSERMAVFLLCEGDGYFLLYRCTPQS